uniref:Uncharacterized protein n=1 Tax=Leptospira santarosai serovar Arenal str. MAVJ 401 TaxID=1049976 RepID=M6JT49_9LEPT|nr:hypothetical protein LEP1GSC063_1891 [Leptospira santarosai serovar Arenal str. MAVJ 401]
MVNLPKRFLITVENSFSHSHSPTKNSKTGLDFICLSLRIKNHENESE